jgi:hypothetical protein
VRGYIAAHANVPAAALTPTEIDAALGARRSRLPRERVVSLLQTCDAARYQPPGEVLSTDACREALESAEQVLSGR